MADKLRKLGTELEKARAKRDEWDRKAKELEKTDYGQYLFKLANRR